MQGYLQSKQMQALMPYYLNLMKENAAQKQANLSKTQLQASALEPTSQGALDHLREVYIPQLVGAGKSQAQAEAIVDGILSTGLDTKDMVATLDRKVSQSIREGIEATGQRRQAATQKYQERMAGYAGRRTAAAEKRAGLAGQRAGRGSTAPGKPGGNSALKEADAVLRDFSSGYRDYATLNPGATMTDYLKTLGPNTRAEVERALTIRRGALGMTPGGAPPASPTSKTAPGTPAPAGKSTRYRKPEDRSQALVGKRVRLGSATGTVVRTPEGGFGLKTSDGRVLPLVRKGNAPAG